MRVARPLAWEDKGKPRFLRFAPIQQRHYGMPRLADTRINRRAFCGIYNPQPVKDQTQGLPATGSNLSQVE
jgi:hypothetical protein